MTNSTRNQSTLVRFLLIAAGSASVALAVLGMALPILPTTPFLLLAAWCYARSSYRFHRWLLNHKIWGKYLRDYISGKGVPKRIKVWAIAMLWITILVSAFVAVEKIWLKILLIAIAIGVSIHILMLKTRHKDQ